MEHPDEYGAVVVQNGNVLEFLEKKPGLSSALVSAGMYVVSPKAFMLVADNDGEKKKALMFERDMFPVLAKRNELGAFICEGSFYDCGTLERWEKAIREL
jgi:NDP-sugar pyrophosphorylase family protein